MRCVWAVVLVCLVSSVTRADNWPNWRGPAFNGVAPGSGYPTKWSATENMRWDVKLPGPGASTPIVWGDKIFLTCGVEHQNAALCLDRKTGAPLWQTTLDEERAGKHKKATGSNPSAVTDGEHVWVYFKNGTLACLDFAGKIVWQENLQKKFGEDQLWWDLGTSPVLTKQNVVVAVMQSEDASYVAALDKASGKLAWKVDRNVPAPEESAQSYSTPVVFNENGRETLVILGGDHVTAHGAATGKELWRAGGLNPSGNKRYRSIASPTVVGDLVIAPYGRGETVAAFRLGGSGDVTDSHTAWINLNLGPDVPTPVVLNGRVYVCRDKGEVACIDLKSGQTIWTGKPDPDPRKAYSSSPILADGKVYLLREDGKTFVLAQGDEFKVLAVNDLGENVATPVVATPVFADHQILIRTLDHLYCIGQ